MDVVFAVDRIPRPGETLLADSAVSSPGGKGLNQAVAAARAGARTTFIGAVGRDPNGEALTDVMAACGISDELVRRSARESGQAFIVVDSAGENMIVVASGANADVTTLTDQEHTAVRSAAVLLMQGELAESVVVEAAEAAKAAGRVVVLNAAPAAPLEDRLIALLDCLIVNEHEACIVSGLEDVTAASIALSTRVDWLIVTLGSAGADIYEVGKLLGRIIPPTVAAVDTTGAGDTFCGAFAAAVSEGRDLMDSVRFATVAAALSVQGRGAVPSIPDRRQIDETLSRTS